MRKASFKIQKVLDEITERQTRKLMLDRGLIGASNGTTDRRRLERQKSGCKNPFFLVQHETDRSTMKPDTNDDETQNETGEDETCADNLRWKKGPRGGRHSVIDEEVEEEMVGGRRILGEEMMQPIKHLSGLSLPTTGFQ